AEHLVNGVQHAAPTGARGEMRQGVENGGDALAERGIGVVVAGGVDRPVDEKGAAHDGLAINKAPVAAVGAVVAVIAHGEIFARGNYQFIALDIFADDVDPFRLHRRNKHLIAGRREGVDQRVVTRGRIVDHVRLVERLAVDVDLLIDNFQVIPGQTDDTFYEMRMVLVGIFENNDVAALQVAIGKKFFVPLAAPAENKFVDQQVIANEQGALHRRRGNLEGLDDEAGAEQRENDGNQERFEIF